jgi:hypothetical protein
MSQQTRQNNYQTEFSESVQVALQLVSSIIHNPNPLELAFFTEKIQPFLAKRLKIFLQNQRIARLEAEEVKNESATDKPTYLSRCVNVHTSSKQKVSVTCYFNPQQPQGQQWIPYEITWKEKNRQKKLRLNEPDAHF